MPSKQARLADFLPYLLSVTSNVVSDRIAAEYSSRFGLKIPEWRVMAVLGDSDAHTQRDLVGATRMDKVAVNRACKVLEDRGLIARSPNARSPNARDGRSHHLELTATGREVHGAIMPLALKMEQQLFAALSAAEQETFKDLLARIRKQAGDKE